MKIYIRAAYLIHTKNKNKEEAKFSRYVKVYGNLNIGFSQFSSIILPCGFYTLLLFRGLFSVMIGEFGRKAGDIVYIFLENYHHISCK
jgi:hypothetical protein